MLPDHLEAVWYIYIQIESHIVCILVVPSIADEMPFPIFPPFLETQKLMQNVELLENQLAGVITLPHPLQTWD